jgi:chromosome segregation ATPase
MEEYRRKYLSPSFARGGSYQENHQTDKAVSELRKELQECKEMEEKFDDLCLDIVKLERENKKIESEQSLVEAEYIEKIKKNKACISDLKRDVLDCRETIETRGKKIDRIERENKKLEAEVERIEKEREQCQKERKIISEEIAQKEILKQELVKKIEEAKMKTKKMKEKCQEESQKLDESFQEIKKKQL